MASVTNNENTMPTDLAPAGDDSDRGKQPQRPEKGESRGGFFTIQKKGQGYWTRLCSAAGAGLIIALTANFVYQMLPAQIVWFNTHQAWRAGIALGVLLVAVLGIWKLMNAPGNVDFLIATDSEMKKVNWTSRRELIGSTKVVIFFMFMIATLLFVLDMYFTRLFYLAGVLLGDAPLWTFAWGIAGTVGKVALDLAMTAVIVLGAAWAVYGAMNSK